MKITGGRFSVSVYWIGLFVAAVLGIYWMIAGKIQLCIFRLFTGLPCPGCGLTRAGIALLKGDWRNSLQYHPLLLPAVLVLLTAAAGRRFGGGRFFRDRRICLILALIFCVFYGIRMILYFPDGPAPMVFDRASLAGKLLDFIRGFSGGNGFY